MTWLLKVEGLTKQFGRGCPTCLEMTGPEHGRNACPICGTIVACADVSFALEPGHTLGIVGESGSGKSTLLGCLYGDTEPTSGAARTAGAPHLPDACVR